MSVLSLPAIHRCVMRKSADLTRTIVVAKAWDDAVRDQEALTKNDGNS